MKPTRLIGVKTTGIYCLPSCPAKSPLPQNTVYFETPEQAEKRMKKEINALLFWTRGRECSKFLRKLEDNEAEIKDLKEDNDSLHRRNLHLERRLEDERSERFAMERHIEDMADTDVEELKFKMDCAEHANGYLQSQLDMATGMLSADEEPAKKRKRMSY